MRIGIDARKIAHYGIGSYIRGLLRGLGEGGGGSSEEYVVFAPQRHRDLIPARFEHVALDTPHYSIRELFTVGRAAAKARLDLLHAPHYVVPFGSCPVVVTIHDLIHLHDPNPLKRIYARTMIGRAVRKSAAVLTVTEAVKQEIVRTFGRENVVVTPNGIDDAFRATAPNTSPGRYFLYAGNDKPHKNVATLVEAFARLRRDISDVTLVLAGAPFEQFQRRDGVICPGFVTESELASLYRDALALVLPSLEEGFGLPAAEAMAAGTAVITSTAPALMEITGDAALHVDAGDASALASAMRRIARDEELRMNMARRGIERAREFTWQRCAQQTRAVYVDFSLHKINT